MTNVLVRSDSALLALAVELFVRHRLDNVGRCPRCGPWAVCRVQERTAHVIRAADVDPVLLVSPKRRPDATHWRDQPTSSLPVYRRSIWFS
jgi:hypothetical protein